MIDQTIERVLYQYILSYRVVETAVRIGASKSYTVYC